MKCECKIHRYHVAHLCACGEVFSHTDDDCHDHNFHGGYINFDPDLCVHGEGGRWGFIEIYEALVVEKGGCLNFNGYETQNVVATYVEKEKNNERQGVDKYLEEEKQRLRERVEWLREERTG